MATYYIDFEGGNDANAGTSFATRWQTITNGATATRWEAFMQEQADGATDPD